MYLSIFSTIWEKLNEIAIDVKDFFLENNRNPILWVGIILIGLALFEIVYNKLHKD